MATFAYVGRSKSGAVKKGELVAKSRDEAVEQLRKQSVVVTSLEEKAAKEGFSFQLGGGVSEKDLVVFTRQFGTMINAGLPLIQCLEILSNQSENAALRKSVGAIKVQVEGRSTFSDALRRHPKVFDDLYVNMVRAGEQSGALVDVLERLSTHYERFAEVQQKFTSALIYPSIVGCVGVLIMFFFMTYMLPKFMEIFEGMSVQLPAATRFLIGISNLFSGYWWLMALLVLAAGVVFKRFQSTDTGKRTIDGWKIRMPILGKVVKLNLHGQFARTLATLLKNGVPVLTALEGLDPNLERAAAACGATPVVAFRRVTLPSIVPAMGSGALFAFAASFDDVVIALLVAGPERWRRVAERLQLDSVLTVDRDGLVAATPRLARRLHRAAG